MFQQLLQQAKDNISTVRAIIKTNENIRIILLNENKITQTTSEDYIKIIDTLKKDIPKTKEWRIYDHCAAVTKLYAIYENFVEDLIRDWLNLLPELFLNYDDLEERIRTTHQFGVGKLLLDLNKNRYEHLSIKEVINGLYLGVNNTDKYELLPDAFLFHEQNLRREILDKLLADAGISNAWQWVNRHKSMKKFIEEIRGGQNTSEGELNELISYRNDAAHGALIDDFLGFNALLELCDFVESICEALIDLVTYKVIKQKERIGKAQKIGEITEWFQKPQAGVAQVTDISLKTNSNLFLVNENIAYCQPAVIQSIQIEGKTIQEVKATQNMEIGLKFDIDAKVGLGLYLLL